jgi:hypothetical protein
MSLVLTGLMNYAAGGHYCDPYFWSGVVRGLSLVSTTKTANRLAGSLSRILTDPVMRAGHFVETFTDPIDLSRLIANLAANGA